MAVIKPFGALRYRKEAGDIQTLTCPPYDIISAAQREAYLTQNPHNVIRLELPQGENPYAQAGDVLNAWLASGILATDPEDALYLYEEEFKDCVDHGQTKSLLGVICRVQLEAFQSGIVLPHEETLSKAKEDRLNLMKATGCNFSQIYSLYQDADHTTLHRLENLSRTTAPLYEFDDGLVTHRLWVVNDKAAIAAICEDFADRKLYIADGHHRYETALNYQTYCHENDLYCPAADHVMMMLVDMAHPGLVVFPTHRLVRGLASFDKVALLESAKEYFVIETLPDITKAEETLATLYAAGEKAFALYTGGADFTLLTLKDLSVMKHILPHHCAASQQLDVSILHNLLLERLLGIDKENMANQVNLTYTRSATEALESVEKGESQCAFLINPTRVSEIGAVAAAGEKMPQKSTYFYPKLITGLAMNKF